MKEYEDDFNIAPRFMADVLRHYRKEKKISQRVLAERAGITKGTISSYEGKKCVPRFEMFIRLAFALDVEPTEMLAMLMQKWRDSFPLEADESSEKPFEFVEVDESSEDSPKLSE